MRRLRKALRGRGGYTLVEMMAASTLLIVLITLCAAAVPPAARAISRLQTLNHAQVILDNVLETSRSELESAQSYVKFYEKGDTISNTGGAASGEAVEFLGENGYLILLSAEGCGATELCRLTALEGGGAEYVPFDTEEAVSPGRLLLRYYLPKGETYAYSRAGTPIARALTTVYSDAFYMRLWLKLEFKPDDSGGGRTKSVTVTASLYRDEERTDLVCSDSLITDLRFAGADGLEIRNAVTAEAVS